jgi:hypothetical protein
MPDKTHKGESRILLPASPADRAPERPLPFAIALLILGAADVYWLYRLAQTPYEFLTILALLAITFFTAVETLSRLE